MGEKTIKFNSKYLKINGALVKAPKVVEPADLCFTAEQAGSTVKLSRVGDITPWTIETSTDGVNFSAYTLGASITLVNVGDRVYFRGSETNVKNQSFVNYHKFIMSGKIASRGNIMSLIGYSETMANYQFVSLFQGCEALTSPPSLPQKTLTQNCYANLFKDDTSLVKVPKLPATNVPTYYYQYMFDGCTSLKAYPTSGEGHDKEWRLPTEETFSQAATQIFMFRGVQGVISQDLVVQANTSVTFYTEYEPV